MAFDVSALNTAKVLRQDRFDAIRVEARANLKATAALVVRLNQATANLSTVLECSPGILSLQMEDGSRVEEPALFFDAVDHEQFYIGDEIRTDDWLPPGFPRLCS